MNILDPRFKYTPAAQTDISRTFRRVRRRLEAEAAARAERDAQNQAERAAKVAPIAKKATAK